jgi:hypothetical protein
MKKPCSLKAPQELQSKVSVMNQWTETFGDTVNTGMRLLTVTGPKIWKADD